jgi:thiol-disulfide isomerase/thioredoxin
MKNTLLLTFIFFTFFSKAQSSDTLKVGDKAPLINITNWIQNIPTDKSLTNKYVVLEFWATWCGPCIAAVPHLNELQEGLKNRTDVVFLSMTYEDVKKVERLLKRVKFQTAVVTDTTNQTQKTFSSDGSGGVGYPSTVLIDKNNIVKWIGEPKVLDKTLLEKFLNNQNLTEVGNENLSVDLGNMTMADTKPKDTKSTHPSKVFEMTKVGEKDPEAVGAAFDKGIYLNTKISLEALLSQLSDIPEYQISIPKEYQGVFYKIKYKNPLMKEAKITKQAILDSVMQQLNLIKAAKSQETGTHILKINDKSKLELSSPDEYLSSESDTDDGVLFTNMSMKSVVDRLTKSLKVVFIDETQLVEKADFLIKLNSMEDVKNSLNSYGISITTQSRMVQKTVFELKR